MPLFRWSNNAAKDLLTEQMRGLAGEWTIPRRVEALYLKQITAERRAEKTDARLSSRSFGAKTDGRGSAETLGRYAHAGTAAPPGSRAFG